MKEIKFCLAGMLFLALACSVSPVRAQDEKDVGALKATIEKTQPIAVENAMIFSAVHLDFDADAIVPRIEGIKLEHQETVAELTEGYTPEVQARSRAPTRVEL